MKQVYENLSVYSADLFGVCSALYELGGLVVMHDASGCNSTYNTHDEPRWWDIDSMVYVSGLVEQDAILGNDERLIDDCVRTAEKEHPKFIALSRSVLPTYMGTDVRGIAHVIEKRTGIPSFGFSTNGMDTYIMGVSMALRTVAERFCRPCGRDENLSVNIIGLTPLDFSVSGNAEALRNYVTESGFSVRSCWAMGDTLENISEAAGGRVSLVVSAAGLDAAEYLRKEYKIPYVAGLPIGKAASERLCSMICEAAETGKSMRLESGREEGTENHGKKVLLIGEAVHCASVRYLLENQYGISNVRILCPLEKDAGMLSQNDMRYSDEKHISAAVNDADIIIADPVYRRVLKKDAVFIDDPHEAYSGRMYHSRGFLFTGRDVTPYSKVMS